MEAIRVTIDIPEAKRMEMLIERHGEILEELHNNLTEIAQTRLQLECKMNQLTLEPPADSRSNIK